MSLLFSLFCLQWILVLDSWGFRDCKATIPQVLQEFLLRFPKKSYRFSYSDFSRNFLLQLHQFFQRFFKVASKVFSRIHSRVALQRYYLQGFPLWKCSQRLYQVSIQIFFLLTLRPISPIATPGDVPKIPTGIQKALRKGRFFQETLQEIIRRFFQLLFQALSCAFSQEFIHGYSQELLQNFFPLEEIYYEVYQ